MRHFALVPLLLLTLAAAAGAAILKMDVTYTGGHIVSGPLSADLAQLPTSVLASFVLTGSATSGGIYGTDDVLQLTLAFGDAVWSVDDLQSFSTSFLLTDSGHLAVTSLSYALAPVDTATVSGRITTNFPLTIRGTDVASGEAFQYQYDTSAQTVTVLPEPPTLVLAMFGFATFSGWGVRRSRRAGGREPNVAKRFVTISAPLSRSASSRRAAGNGH